MKYNMKCRFGLHVYTQWNDIFEGTLEKTKTKTNTTVAIGNYIIQSRKCVACGKKELRREVEMTR